MKIFQIVIFFTLLFFLLATSCEKKVEIPIPLPKVPGVEVPPVGFKVVKPTGTEVFFEDFESYGMGEVAPFGPWKFLGKPPHVEEGVQPNRMIGKILKVESPDQVLYLTEAWRDFVLELNAKIIHVGYSALKVFFRLSEDGKRGYYVSVPGGRVSLWKFAGATQVEIAKSADFDVGGDWFYLRIEAVGDQIRVYHNGRKVIDVRDPDPSLMVPGGIGLSSDYWDNYYDNVRVEVIPAG